jgi:SAM-dependent methyltransferase
MELEAFVLDHVLADRCLERVLDLGTGDGHMLATIRCRHPGVDCVGTDISPFLLDAARRRLGERTGVRLVNHSMARPLPRDWGPFDLVVSALAIHHLNDARKRTLYREIHDVLVPGGLFCNIDVVDSASANLRNRSAMVFSYGTGDAHASDCPALLTDQLTWLSDAGFIHVDCYWKWLKLTVLAGERPV